MACRLLATMFTTTTYGTWLPGDLRGYVDHGRILPHNPAILQRAAERLKGKPVHLTPAEQVAAFDALLAACAEFGYTILAVSIESWHAHLLVDHAHAPPPAVIGRLKTRMRQAIVALRGRSPIGRIWTAGYDARHCFDPRALAVRHAYITRHRGHRPLPDPLEHPSPTRSAIRCGWVKDALKQPLASWVVVRFGVGARKTPRVSGDSSEALPGAGLCHTR